ncbi:hypothetical protein [Confluentibacter flavum]|uniref:DUF481 domain-containing protein n=1 Tax=Confluentibacter flavum TaxID=1909700 RepID=A0A2N3HPI7_9FLAO|nr:hypothetical protein [Confluentibacter flavum]PKQ46837.1 hypothetical protein CSW08_00565 [Confluentibacter flavum]
MTKLLLTIIIFCFAFQSFSQDSNSTVRVFLDCDFCDNTYIKQNLNNVEFVRDQNFADVHLFFVRQINGSGGSLYDIDFIGKNELEYLSDKISFSTDSNMTNDDVRNRILNFIKLGLVRYWLKREQTDVVTITVNKREGQGEEEVVDDPWNYWVFELNARGDIDGEQQRKQLDVDFSASAKRVTEQNKFSIRASYSENKSTFNYENEEINAIRQSKDIRISDVISIGGNWSVGAFGRIGSSVYSNQDFYWELKPAIEFNFFDYSKSAEKQLVLSYRNGMIYNEYIETSVFAKDDEHLWEHEVILGGTVNKRWGNIFAEASFEQYLNDTTLNAFRFYLGTSIRVFKGFNLNINGNYRIVSNQINLPAGDVSLEELLLRQQQLASGFEYSLRIGISYSFGSIYNTIVNPRFNF